MIETFKKITIECGHLLLKLSSEERAKGKWELDQFKAEADVIAHNFLTQELKLKFNLPIISEEDNIRPDQLSGDYIIIDPIDGTASYAQGFKGWVTQVALMTKNSPKIGVVYAPTTNELFWAEAGKGSYCNEQELNISISSNYKIESIIDNYPSPQGITKEIVEYFKIPKYIESGSLGLKICRVASGSVDLFFKAMNPKDWDLAAPQLILTEAGGIITDARGNKIMYGSKEMTHKGLIATSSTDFVKEISTWYQNKIRSNL